MEIKEKLVVDYPLRAPMKIIGDATALKAVAIAEIIHAHLGDQAVSLPEGWEVDYQYTAQTKGAWVSHTFWVTFPDEHAERPLREAIHKLPGVVMQL